MKKLLVVIAVFALTGSALAADEPFGSTGYSENTTIIEASPTPDDGEGCPGDLIMCWTGFVDNGYCWQFGGVVEPDYGSWAECYMDDKWFICELHLYFTQTGYYMGQTCDVYVWENDPGTGYPGNVAWVAAGQSPGPIAFWPSCSAHKFGPVKIHLTNFWVGFWPGWPGDVCGWYICAEETGIPGICCPVTKFAPGIGYPTGWGPVNLVPIFQPTGMGIGFWGFIVVTPTEEVTWGQIKSLY
jgi:hypothetical protein